MSITGASRHRGRGCRHTTGQVILQSRDYTVIFAARYRRGFADPDRVRKVLESAVASYDGPGPTPEPASEAPE